ncbi:hypothetical protein AALP_AA3G195300 [Arabis alpina]|uniref:Uncharacterized protein n=1 Tax=Arabis alpina TaxID=50452 RepID=A0A087HAA5_ARAAL|nr:hypothetical protein AALP_AA3G195300 [Arabis alpina]
MARSVTGATRPSQPDTSISTSTHLSNESTLQQPISPPPSPMDISLTTSSMADDTRTDYWFDQVSIVWSSIGY